MSSAEILAFPHSEPFPPAQVLDLAVNERTGQVFICADLRELAELQRLLSQPLKRVGSGNGEGGE